MNNYYYSEKWDCRVWRAGKWRSFGNKRRDVKKLRPGEVVVEFTSNLITGYLITGEIGLGYQLLRVVPFCSDSIYIYLPDDQVLVYPDPRQ